MEVNPLNFELIEYLNQNNIKWRSQYFIMDLRTLKIIKNMGADSFKIKGPLLFQLDDVFATIGHEGGTVFVDPIPFISPIEAAFGDIITTAWINPKHMPLVCKKYPRIGVAFETSWKNQADRKAYTSIYNTAVWNAPLDSLLKVETSNFKDEYKFPVSFLPEEFTERRLNCRQKCTSNGCYFCKAMFNKVILFYLYAKTKLKEKEQSQD